MWRCWSNDRGTSAVEFALIAPALIMLLVGGLSLCLMLFAVGSMHYAVEDAARCASAKPTVCSDGPSAIAFAKSRYKGILATPAFTYATAACGHQVSASVTYSFDVGIYRWPVSLSATSCFP
jgi:Flp pilus assembly protein TadG